MTNHDDFSLPDIASIFEEYDVQDKEHPIYTAYKNDTDDKTLNKVNTHKPPKKRPGLPNKPVNNTNKTNNDNTGHNEYNEHNEHSDYIENNEYDEYNEHNDNGETTQYYTDKRTGIGYEILPGSDPEALKAFKASKGAGLSLGEMFEHTDLVEDFDSLDLANAAKRFLPHLQVPLSEEERKEAERKVRESNHKAKIEQEERRKHQERNKQQKEAQNTPTKRTRKRAPTRKKNN